MGQNLAFLLKLIMYCERKRTLKSFWKEPEPLIFDQVIFATHAPTTLRLLRACATDEEKRILGVFRYSSNPIYIHSDTRLMPRNKSVWSSCNFISRTSPTHNESVPSEHRPVCVTYWLNRLQNLNRYAMDVQDLFVTLHPILPVDDTKIFGTHTMQHPQFTLEAVKAQKELPGLLQGKTPSWFCGAYTRYGFHEDVFSSGLDVVEKSTDGKIIRPWTGKLSLSMTNNKSCYSLPYANPKTSLLLFWCTLFVVVQRLAKGRRKMSPKMMDGDPIVIVSSGNGRLLRVEPRLETSTTTTNSKSCFASIGVRTPKLFARVTDALTKGGDFAPILVQAFIAGEIDAPTARDLTQALMTLFVGQNRNRAIADGYRGRMKLAESLLVSLVGGFQMVKPFCVGLVTALSSVVYPAWWRTFTDAYDDGSGERPPKQRRKLELVGDLC